jgi:hypothetical protein
MLADSEAMMVDALTYLFNLMAERIKNQPLTDGERRLSPSRCHYQRELRRLYLELIPPSISVLTLLVVTCLTIREASETLRTSSEDEEEQGEGDSVSLPIMMTFSAANLLLDIVNVTCFARANLNFGLETVRREQFTINDSLFGANPDEESQNPEPSRNPSASQAAEGTPLLATASSSNGHASHQRRISSSDLYQPSKKHEIVNLNMCSAWTVRTSSRSLNSRSPSVVADATIHCFLCSASFLPAWRTACLRRYVALGRRVGGGSDCRSRPVDPARQRGRSGSLGGFRDHCGEPDPADPRPDNDRDRSSMPVAESAAGHGRARIGCPMNSRWNWQPSQNTAVT